MEILSVSGWSGSGKTTLIAALIPFFTMRGLRVSSVKHAHHSVMLDQPGKDSFIHAESGAREVILSTENGFALFSRQPATLAALCARLAPVDLVLAEGFKAEPISRLAVYRPVVGKPVPWPDSNLLAVASDENLPDCPVPVLALDAPEKIADFLTYTLKLNTPGNR